MAEVLNPDLAERHHQAPATAKTVFEEFLLAEYNNIAQAHFHTVTSISEFFKHYIVLVSLPISVAVIFLKPSELQTSGILGFFKSYPLVPTMVLVLVTLLGFAVLGYVVNLRFDAILYARTVNGIRRHFSESSKHSGEAGLRFLALPTSTHFPLYVDTGYFFFVVLTFAIVGTSYLSAGLYLYWELNKWPINTTFWFLLGFCGWLHFFLYAFLGWQRERGYLRRPVVGVDIDGVLNDHRAHFAKVLKDQTDKDLDPDLITEIPVHKMAHTNIERNDECAVFNWPNYWIEMPPLDGAADCIKKLRNTLGYRIWFFTHRDWPQPKTYPKNRERDYRTAWAKASLSGLPAQWETIRAIEDSIAKFGIPSVISSKPIRSITRKWLRQNGFKYNRLIIEKVNTEATEPLMFTRNRFWASKHLKIRAFVEDDLIKAKKLAHICTLVFLIDHPYNQIDSDELPKNVLRVESWDEIYDSLKEIF